MNYACFTFSLQTVSFSSLGTPLRWTMANCTPIGKSLKYLSKSALKMVELRVDGKESVVSCCTVSEQTFVLCKKNHASVICRGSNIYTTHWQVLTIYHDIISDKS